MIIGVIIFELLEVRVRVIRFVVVVVVIFIRVIIFEFSPSGGGMPAHASISQVFSTMVYLLHRAYFIPYTLFVFGILIAIYNYHSIRYNCFFYMLFLLYFYFS